MQATIADIRRGDRFTWGGITYLAVDDARPNTGGFGPDAWDILVIKAAGRKRGPDGVIDLGMALTSYYAVRHDFPVEITERDIPLTHVAEGIHEGADIGIILGRLDHIMQTRALVHRRADDVDGRRDVLIRKALAAGASVPDLMGRTGLSRPRIYQIRDGRR